MVCVYFSIFDPDCLNDGQPTVPKPLLGVAHVTGRYVQACSYEYLVQHRQFNTELQSTNSYERTLFILRFFGGGRGEHLCQNINQGFLH